MTNNLLKFGLMYDRKFVPCSIDRNDFSGDDDYRIYKIENQVNGIMSIWLSNFEVDGWKDWVLFGYRITSELKMELVMVKDKLVDVCSTLLDLVKNREVTLYTNASEDFRTVKTKIGDDVELRILFPYNSKEKQDAYGNEMRITCGQFKKLLLTKTNSFYKDQSHILKNIADAFGYDHDEFNADLYTDFCLINEFCPVLREDQHFEAPLDSGIVPVFQYFITELFLTDDQFIPKLETIKAFILAKIDFWNTIKQKIQEFQSTNEKKNQIDGSYRINNWSYKRNIEPIKGSYFNVNGIWNNKENKTETSKIWDIIDSIGIVLMRLLPLILIVIIIIIVYIIVKINNAKDNK